MSTAPGTQGRRRPQHTAKAAGKPTVTLPDDDLPASAFNLDDLEREGEQVEPFQFIHDKRVYELSDPHEKDWQELIVVLNNPLLFLRLVLREGDKDAFFENPMPAWKLNALTRAYRAHYGLPSDPGESGGLSI